MAVPRTREAPVRADLARKMVFVAGPRQVGKTTLARRLLADEEVGVYLSWDRAQDRKEVRAAQWPGGEALVVLDELHKWRPWKRWLKGEYDRHRDRMRFLVTGSARLDVYRRGGDSLEGRYHHYRLHPFTCGELARGGAPPVLPAPGEELRVPARADRELPRRLLEAGAFPEPFLAGSARAVRRWRKERLDRVLREDVRDLTAVRDVASLELLAGLLPERVGSPLSLNSLREDLEVSHGAVAQWVAVLERLYHVFQLRPHTSSRVRGLRKMTKTYLWDAGQVEAPGPRFENLVALHLLALCHYLEDHEGRRAELRYLRDRAGREVDFLVVVDGRPWFAVEAKLGETRIDPALRYFQSRLGVPWAYQVVLEGERDFVEGGVRCLPAANFLAALV
jgi:uncharacterized protein